MDMRELMNNTIVRDGAIEELLYWISYARYYGDAEDIDNRIKEMIDG